MSINYEIAKGNLETLLLHSLSIKPMSAYEIIKEFQEKLGLLFSAGTIYSKLYKMEREGKIKHEEKAEGVKFQITEKGRQCLKENMCSLKMLCSFLEL